MTQWRSLKLPGCIEKPPKIQKIPKKSFLSKGKFPVVSQEKGLINGYWDQEADAVKVDRPLVIFGDHTQVVKLVDFDFVVGADGVKVLKPREFLAPEYLYYYLLGHPQKELGYARHYRLLKELDVRFPILSEQQRIVSILDEAFSGIETAIANTEKNLANVRGLFESLLNVRFLNVPDHWSKEKLSKVCGFQGGSQPPKSAFISEPRSGYVRLLQIRDFKSDDKAVYIPESSKNRLCSEYDIMIGRYGASVGQIHSGKAGAYNVALIKTIPDLSRIEPRFLFYYLRSKAFQEPLASVASRSAQAGFSKSDISSFLVPLPCINDQHGIIEVLDDVWGQTSSLKRNVNQKLNALTELKQSLLQKAFSGELTADKLESEVDQAVA